MCPNGETCINTDGSFFCQKPCDGLIDELDFVSGTFKHLYHIFGEKPTKMLRIYLCNVM